MSPLITPVQEVTIATPWVISGDRADGLAAEADAVEPPLSVASVLRPPAPAASSRHRGGIAGTRSAWFVTVTGVSGNPVDKKAFADACERVVE